MNKLKQILKSWAVWVSLLSLVGLILVQSVGFDSDIWNAISSCVLSILIGFGIVNNPNCKTGLGYNDDSGGDTDDIA